MKGVGAGNCPYLIMANYTITNYKLENVLINLGDPFGFTPFILCRILDDWQDSLVGGDRMTITGDIKRALYNYGKTHTTVYAISGKTVDFDASSFGYHTYPIKSSNDIVKMNVYKQTDHGLAQTMLFANESFSKEVLSNTLTGRARPWWLFVDRDYMYINMGPSGFDFVTIDLTQYYTFDTFDHFVDSNGLPYGVGEGYVPYDENYFSNVTHTFYGRYALGEIRGAEDDPYKPGGNTEPSPFPGTGDFDNTSDPIDVSQLPVLSAVDTRFISLFKPDLTQLQSLATYMWGANFDLETFKKLFNDPMAAILGLSIVPVVPPTAAAAPITLGNITTTISMPKITSQYVQVPCGTLNVNEYWGAYLDYSPFTKLEIYLPYIGVQTLDADDIMGRSVEVVYNIDVLSGACVAQLKCGDSVLYSFAGSCAVSIPITGRDWTNMINGIIGVATAAAGIAVAGATGGASVAAAAAGGALSQTANSLSSMKPTVQKSGTMAAGSGMLAIQKPYLILTRPRQALPENQNKYTGYPSFITATLGDLTGMTYVYEIHLENIDCTQAEQAEIETLLKNGVIL